MATILKRGSVIDTWATIVEQGGGHEKWFMDMILQFLNDAKIPDVKIYRDDVGFGMFSLKRNLLILTHNSLREFRMFIGVREYGANLDVSWFVTANPSGVKRMISKKMTGNPLALSQQMDSFSQQELSAFTTVAHHCVVRVVKLLYEELKQDPTSLNTSSKGFLSVW